MKGEHSPKPLARDMQHIPAGGWLVFFFGGRRTAQSSGNIQLEHMKKNLRLTRILVYQHLGFLTIITICWLNELLKLPSLIFSNHPFAFVYRKSTLDMLLVLAVWLLVSGVTRRLLERVRYLERFLRMCSWCRRIDYSGDWMPLEEFMQRGFDTPTTHGICPECLRLQREALQRTKVARQNGNDVVTPEPSASVLP
jgi:hypothetical protein